MIMVHRRRGVNATQSESREVVFPFTFASGVKSEDKLPAPFVYTGLASAFRKAGFKEVARRSEARPIFRFVIGG